ncbi:sphingosine kinase 2-like [Paramacrobiotus metropolitanus]|uniref:sphingosine kinase 2-like n=1 Tax=Paramacrobiotus metropolitanus TaxID=2943436 RepID=UPI002446006A|nr:sphingosine kinase 2-like [Paramacrobiotus metropolitanus]
MSEQTITARLTGQFSLLGSRKVYNVYLTDTSIKYAPAEGNAKWKEVLLDDVVGVHCMRGKSADDPQVYLSFFVYKRGRTLMGGVDPVRKRQGLTFVVGEAAVFEENLLVADKWRNAIYRLMRSAVSGLRDPHSGVWLVVINPAGGPGKAEKLFRERVVPIFAEAAIPFEVIVSERAGHVMEIMQTLDLSKYSALIVVAGDGLVHEALNGLMMRPDWAEAVRIPIGHIPGGSGNALAASIHEASGEPFRTEFVKHSALLLAKSVPTPLDIVYLETPWYSRYGFLSVCWGLIADIDIESEKYRNLGETRFTVQAVQRITDLRTYSGVLSYLPADSPASGDAPAPHSYLSDAHLPKPSTDLLVPLSEPVSSTWTTIDGDFITVCLVVISRLAASSAGIPWAKLNDGLGYLFWIKAGAPKMAVTSFLLNMDSGSHLANSHVQKVAVRAFRLEPREKDGILTIDGEKVQYGSIQGQMLPSLATVLTRRSV